MSKHNDGGPAFPAINSTFTGVSSEGVERYDSEVSGGMTLRDYFAAKSLQGMYAADTSQSVMPLNMKVAESYAAADAMLKEREK